MSDPEGNEVLKKLLKDKSKISFTTQNSTISLFSDGEYKFCFLTTTSNWIAENRNIRLSFRIVVGETEQNYQELAKKEHLTNLQLASRKILDLSRNFITV